MDFINFSSEFESLNQFSKQGLTTLNNFNIFFKTLHKYSDLFCINAKKSSDQIFNEMIKYDSKTTTSKHFFDFYRNFENYLSKIKHFQVKIEKDINEPANLFAKHLNGRYIECLSEFKTMATTTYEGKKNLEKSKHKYFDSCKLSVEQEKLVIKTMDNREKNQATDDDVEHAHDILIKLRTQAENNCQNYKAELTKTNKLFDDMERKFYFPILDKLKLHEESRINFLKFHFEKFGQILEEFTVATYDFLNRMNTSLQMVKVEEDIKLFDERFNFLYKNNERIPREEFLNYDIYRRNLEKMLSNNQIGGTATNGNLHSIEDFSTAISDREYNFTNNSSVSTQNSPEEKEKNLINNFFRDLQENDNEINLEEFTIIHKKIDNNLPFSKLFIDTLLVHYKQNLYIEVRCYENLHHFANVFHLIINNTEIKKEIFDMNFAVIYIAEKTFYKNYENNFDKIYLCKLLSRNKIYTDKKFWMELIGIKINSLIDQKIAIEVQKREKELYNMSLNHSAISPENSPSSNAKNKNLISSIGSRVKNLFGNPIIKENKIVESSMVQTFIYDQIKTNEAANVVKEYIVHFANFSFDVSEAIDIIVELSHKYNYEKEKVSYFISLMNSNLFTIKNKSNYVNRFSQNLRNKNKINSNSNNSLSTKEFSKHLKLNDNCMTILAYSLKYLDVKDYPVLIQLNKNSHKKLSKIIYKNVLLKCQNLNNKMRIAIWKNLLNINGLKKQNSYSDILKTIKNEKEKYDTMFIETIELDVQRTSFEGNIEKKRRGILNILSAVAYSLPHINYCQGMNYVAAFLYEITNNHEEDSFYLMLGLLKSTEFGDIFVNDLSRLKQFFYVFERLLHIYFPELFIYFKNNSILASYFISPWFITLFTNCYQYISGNTHNPKILLRIWDQFLLTGWKSILSTGLCIIKHYESSLIQLKYEDLLHFLINDIIKYGFFQNSNYDYFINLWKNGVKLHSGLISNLENEYVLDLKMKEVEDKKKENKKSFNEKENTFKI